MALQKDVAVAAISAQASMPFGQATKALSFTVLLECVLVFFGIDHRPVKRVVSPPVDCRAISGVRM